MKISGVYFTREALASFRHNLVQSIAAVTTVALCLFVVGLILVVLLIGRQLITKVENKVEIEVFLEGVDTPQVSPAGGSSGTSSLLPSITEVNAVGDLMRSWPEVKRVKYVSKEEALGRFKKQIKQPEVLRNMSGNPLPASYEVILRNPRDVDKVAKRIKQLPDIERLVGTNLDDNIKYGADTVRKLFQFTRWLSVAAAGFAALLIFVSLVLITNTIRLAIFARRKEIGIMRLVGASSWFIRWPFLLEGMLQGIIGSFIAMLVLTGLWRTVFTNLAQGKMLAFLAIPLDQMAFARLLVLLAIGGMMIGAAGSAIALRRFLKT